MAANEHDVTWQKQPSGAAARGRRHDLGIPLASSQVEYSLLHRQPEVNGVLDACRELGVTLIAYQPLASGALTGRYTPGVRPDTVSCMRRQAFQPGFKLRLSFISSYEPFRSC